MSSIVWSHCLCSGRMSKSFFANTDLNPLAQSGRVRSPFHVSEARRAPSASFWEIVEVARRSSATDSERILVMKSLFPCSYSTPHIRRGILSSSESSAYSGGGPDRQTLTALTSIFLRNACSFRIAWHPSHQGGHLFICTSPVCQLTSGLWSLSQV